MLRAVILTALPVVYRAVRIHFRELIEETHPQGTIYERGKFIANGNEWDVGIAQVEADIVDAALKTQQAIFDLKPNILFFVGIAGGIKDVAIGDVVAATKVYCYESGKVGDKNQFFTRPDLGQSAHALVERARVEALKEDWRKRLASSPASQPHVLVGPIATGEKVVASRQSYLFKFLRESFNDAIAVEMEGFGFLSAAFAYPHIKAIVIRGISNLNDGQNDDSVESERDRQEKASAHASAFAFEILAKLQIEPLERRTEAEEEQPQRPTEKQNPDKLTQNPSGDKIVCPSPSTPLKGNYDKLRNFLEKKAWQEADRETSMVILQVAKRQKNGWLRARDIENFSCSDICEIDRLWLDASEGKFGLSVQQKIWLDVEGQPGKFEPETFRNFCDQVGWRVNDDWIRQYNEFNFSLDAPKGHFPSLRFPCAEDDLNWFQKWKDSFRGFLIRVDFCL